jgi:hypothetical protein
VCQIGGAVCKLGNLAVDFAHRLLSSLIILNSNRRHVIAYELYKPNNKSCSKRRSGTYIMDVGQFARAYVAQKEQDYEIYYKKNYGKVDSLDYTTCTEVYYNDNPVSSDVFCGIFHVRTGLTYAVCLESTTPN